MSRYAPFFNFLTMLKGQKAGSCFYCSEHFIEPIPSNSKKAEVAFWPFDLLRETTRLFEYAKAN